MHQFKELKVWQKSVELATEVYNSTKNFPPEEKFGITSQIRRSVVSIGSNIAEGAGRKSKKEFKYLSKIKKNDSMVENSLNIDGLEITQDNLNSLNKYEKIEM